ncbi:autotransporter family protein [Brucella grignonensis]|uniref:autotransporter family protein n=1 Tax=Brucella grignonensis TaxID=94627 RepID=UPI001F241A68|nr:autotransporter domain-containing protein [Brucella grignonensis]
MSTTVWAQEIYKFFDSNGRPFVTAKYYGVNDGPFGFDNNSSTWDLSSFDVDQLNLAVKHWVEIIQVTPGAAPAIFNIGTMDDYNAYAFSPIAFEREGAPTKVQAALTGQNPGDLINGAQGFIQIGTLPWTKVDYTPSQLPMTSEISLTATMIHEIGHALGVSSNFQGEEQDDGSALIYINETPNSWISHLYDDNGQKSRPDQIVWCSFCDNIALNDDDEPLRPEDIFDVRNNSAYFGGAHVADVLAGAMAGVPLSMVSSRDPNVPDVPFLAHIELKNSLMSHQPYRNYTNFMEAELAILQDLGYKIDRRNFFGYSIYGDDQTLINDNPFFGRNAEGTAYLQNTYNTATLGLGLHVYGGNNTITQRADLLSAGAGGAGIRVDGSSNDLSILPETHIYADGVNGRGVMFAYGKDHTFTHRGDIQALGQDGIAVSFDFGHNAMGDDGPIGEYRGSYILRGDQSLSRYSPEALQTAWNEINGSLVSTFDLTGRAAGKKAAIYMSDNAYVGQINVMQGARIAGDIISNYEEVDEEGDLRLTTLTFGQAANNEGHSIFVADSDFSLTYDGNITGQNLSLQINGGNTKLTGDHLLYNATVAQSATLSGSGLYQINSTQKFLNDGVLNPSVAGQAIEIEGDYLQSATGTLQFSFNDQKAISRLIVNGNAQLDGTITFAPERGWYADGFSVTSGNWLNAETMGGDFNDVSTSLASPTLTATATHDGSNIYTVSLSRANKAYSQYGNTANSLSVGYVFDALGNNVPSGLRPLMAALDFSAPDGSTIGSALPDLSGEAYASASGVLANASGISRSAINSRLQQAFGGNPAAPVSVIAYAPTPQLPSASKAINVAAPNITSDGISRYAAWGTAYGSWSSQSSDRNAARTKSTIGGFTTGIDASVYENWRLGVMAGYNRTTFKTVSRNASGSSDNYTLGTYGGTEWAAAIGSVGLRTGLAYSWHKIEMDRSVAFNGFSDILSADYNAGTFQVFGELDYKLNVSPRSTIEPYANLAYVHFRTDGFTEEGRNGAALSVQSDTMDTTLSTIGFRASTNLEIGNILTTARSDLGWRHAFGDVIPTSAASFAAGSDTFTTAGNSIGKDTALIEAGLDFAVTENAKFGVTYHGQFGSRITQSGVNANFSMKF